MELRHLRYFCAVADHGTFSEAGRQLQVSQSAISEQIANLGREVAGTLLNRSSGRTRLTPHGQRFLAEARKTLLASSGSQNLYGPRGRMEPEKQGVDPLGFSAPGWREQGSYPAHQGQLT
jgi:DNA-binding transcriptional LysR family regulator